jgi:hypothetical protein
MKSNQSSENALLVPNEWDIGSVIIDDDLLESDVILPAQLARRAILEGEKKLLFAVLEDAIHCFIHRRGRLRREAEFWIMSDRGTGVFAFRNLCEQLDIDPVLLRQRLRGAKKEKIKSPWVTPCVDAALEHERALAGCELFSIVGEPIAKLPVGLVSEQAAPLP